MLTKPSDEVADCYSHARVALERAKHAADAVEELDWLKAERGWLLLAQSIELVERIADFRSAAKIRRAALSVPGRCPACGRAMRPPGAGEPQSSPGADRSHFECQTCDITVLHPGHTTGD